MRDLVSGSAALLLAAAIPLQAHNYVVHRDMTDLAYEIMIVAAEEVEKPAGERLIGRPAGNVTPAEWENFLKDIANSRKRIAELRSGLQNSKRGDCSNPRITVDTGWAFNQPLGKLPHAVALNWFTGDDCGIDFSFAPKGIYADHNRAPFDVSGQVLGFWAASIDDHVNDTHFFLKPTSMAGLGAAATKADELATNALAIPLIPLFCLFECIFGDCDDCASDARDFADAVNPTDELLGLVPGIFDIKGLDYVGVWHFIGMHPGAPNIFDDRGGYQMESGGPSGQPDAMVTGLMAGLDLLGWTLNWDDSDGPKQYEIGAGGDFHKDTNTRSPAKWMFPTFPHLIFEPADNLGKFGWDKFRALLVSAEPLSWPLHAIGDATVPMHVVGTSGWGHRPFEDAMEDSWPRLLFLSDSPSEANESRRLQTEQAIRILAKAFHWRQFILDWRASHAGQQKNVPVRDLVTALAQETFDYANSQQPSGWPYDPNASLLYLVEPGLSQNIYQTNAAIEKARPLIENGAAATLAFLMSAMER
jgi:hypothetical protein